MTRILSTDTRTDLVIATLSLGSSIFLAEALYKFKSFTLECLAFLATWAILDFAFRGIARVFKPREA